MMLHHVQISMPAGGEDEARRFYGECLGLREVPKPVALADRGGCWFRSVDGERVMAELHLGVDEHFVPAAKAHPALMCHSLEHLEQVGARVEGAGYPVSWAERDTFEGFVRFHARDGFGNRIELLAIREP